MKRVDLIRHLESHGCQFIREGGSHTVYFNPNEKRIASVPRHREIKNPTTLRICRQLAIPDPERR